MNIVAAWTLDPFVIFIKILFKDKTELDYCIFFFTLLIVSSSLVVPTTFQVIKTCVGVSVALPCLNIPAQIIIE